MDNFGAHKNIGEIRHIGLINAMELVTDKDKKIGFDGDLRIGYEIYKKHLPTVCCCVLWVTSSTSTRR